VLDGQRQLRRLRRTVRFARNALRRLDEERAAVAAAEVEDGGDAFVNGLDKYGNVLCKGFAFSPPYPSLSNWTGVTLIGYRPADGSYFGAGAGIPAGFTPPAVRTTPSGESFTYMNQNYLLEGGVFRSPDGAHWTQFNDDSPLALPFAP